MIAKDLREKSITYRLERIAEGAKAMVDARMAETTKNRNWEERFGVSIMNDGYWVSLALSCTKFFTHSLRNIRFIEKCFKEGYHCRERTIFRVISS